MRTSAIRFNRNLKQYATIAHHASLSLATTYTIYMVYRAEQIIPTVEGRACLISKGSIVDGQDCNYAAWMQHSLLGVDFNYRVLAGYRAAAETDETATTYVTAWNTPPQVGRWSSMALIVNAAAPTTVDALFAERLSIGPTVMGVSTGFGDGPLSNPAKAGVPPTTASAVLIGANLSATGAVENFADISVCEIAIYNIALSLVTLNARFGTRLTGNETGLVAYYRCDEGSGSTLYDVSGNGRDATLKNNPTWTDGPLDLYY